MRVTRPLALLPGDDVPALSAALRSALDGSGPAVLPLDASGADASRSAPPVVGQPVDAPPALVPRRVALVIETSGSTGRPKRVALSADALLAHAAASAAALGSRASQERTAQWLLCLPAHYIAGTQVLVRSIVAGTEPAVARGGHFDAEVFCEASARMTGDERYTSLVPVQLARLIGAAEADDAVRDELRRFDAILVGGQALDVVLRERAAQLDVNIVRTYGSSETAGGCVYDGRPLAGVIVRTVDGAIELAGPTLAEGYLDDPERTEAAFPVAEGRRWYRTGDLGELGPDGRVVVTGRADGVIISGGEKVLLDAVERHVRTLPGLSDAVVVAVDDDRWGQVPVVVSAEWAARGGTALEEVRRSAASAISRAAAPARIVAVAELPLLASGKPDRMALKAHASAVVKN